MRERVINILLKYMYNLKNIFKKWIHNKNAVKIIFTD